MENKGIGPGPAEKANSRSGVTYATTSAALKLLRRRRMGRKLGRSVFEPFSTTCEALLVIQSDFGDDACAALATEAMVAWLSWTDVVDWWFPRLVGARVGRREGVGDGGGRSGRRIVVVGLTELVVAALFRVVVPLASRGILFGA